MIAQAAETVLFYLLAASAIVLALAVTHTKRLLRAAIYLMFVLLTSAGFYVMLGAEFLAGIQVLVYVGGLVVLIVFAVMLTRSADLSADAPSWPQRLLAAGAAATFLALTIWAFCKTTFPLSHGVTSPSDEPLAIGRQLLDRGAGGFVLPFEVISVLLLAAAIGGMVVARKVPPPGQPFTSGGDLPGEADFQSPKSQREAKPGDKT